ncbi:MAG: TIGR04282 family arsenosugar biosynthesis glycosyltransferase [Verrucomicrobiales bacterium]|nr:TIGR04282 family arsenosugar biosynthesis glycosyltransferase [Verrucomicrobiales bacterium]
METRGVMVFFRAPRKGTVKTRLAAQVGQDAALAIHQELVELTLDRLGSISELELKVTPDDALAEVTPLIRTGWTLAPQGGGDLGDRLARGFESAFARRPGRWVAIGTDCPGITALDLGSAWDLLGTADVVLGPALDGGYWLIGLRAPQPDLFREIPWGGPNVFESTLDRIRSSGLTLAQLRPLGDVDTHADWTAWRAQRDGSSG